MNTFIIFIICLVSFLFGRIFNKIKKLFLSSSKNNEILNNKEYLFDVTDDLKMVFLVRQDLKMGAGKIAAQVAHAAIGLYDDIFEGDNNYQKSALDYWFNLGQKKVVLK